MIRKPAESRSASALSLRTKANEISRLYEAFPGLDSAALKRHLAVGGFGEILRDIEKAAQQSKAPFLSDAISPEHAEVLWSRAFGAVSELVSLDAALDYAKKDMLRTLDSSSQRALKARHMALERSINDGTIWAEAGS